MLDWNLGARRVVDLIRAADYSPFASPWGSFRTSFDGEEVAILRAARTGEPSAEPAGTVGAADDAGALISAGDAWVRAERAERAGEPVAPAEVFRPGGVCVAPSAN